jgi:hypothetical protein
MAVRLRLQDENADCRRSNLEGDGNDDSDTLFTLRRQLPAGHGALPILPRRRADSDRSERHSRERENPSIPTRQGSKCPIERQQHRCFGIGLATAGPDASSRQHGLSLSQRRDIRGIKVPIRKTLRGGRGHRPSEPAILWDVWGTERPVWRPMDVSHPHQVDGT